MIDGILAMLHQIDTSKCEGVHLHVVVASKGDGAVKVRRECTLVLCRGTMSLEMLERGGSSRLRGVDGAC